MRSKTNSASGEWAVSARIEAPFVRPAQTFVTAGTTKPSTWPVDELYAAYANDPQGHLMTPHVGGRRCNLDWHHPLFISARQRD